MRFFATLIGSFTGIAAYRAARRAQGVGLAYVFKLALFTATIVVLAYGLLTYHYFFTPQGDKPAIYADVLEQIAAQTPPMHFAENRLTTDQPEVTIIHVDATVDNAPYRKELITIDTTGTTTAATMTTPILVTSEAIITNLNGKVKIQPYHALNEDPHAAYQVNRSIAQKMVAQWIAFVQQNLLLVLGVLLITGWLVMSCMLFLTRTAMVLLLSLGGLLIGMALRTPIDYGAAMRLSAVSFTPVAMLELVRLLTTGAGLDSLTLFICGTIMLSAAIYVTREESLASGA